MGVAEDPEDVLDDPALLLVPEEGAEGDDLLGLVPPPDDLPEEFDSIHESRFVQVAWTCTP